MSKVRDRKKLFLKTQVPPQDLPPDRVGRSGERRRNLHRTEAPTTLLFSKENMEVHVLLPRMDRTALTAQAHHKFVQENNSIHSRLYT